MLQTEPNNSWQSRTLEEMIRLVSRLDQAAEEEELRQGLPALLQSVAAYTRARGVSLLEWAAPEETAFCCTVQWHAEPAASALPVDSSIPAAPEWTARLAEGEMLRLTGLPPAQLLTADEHAALAAQGRRCGVAVPLLARHRLQGFLWLDSPAPQLCTAADWALTAVCGHLGSLRECFRTRGRLARKNEALEHEKRLLEVLCTDCTSVYDCDLTADTMRPIKRGVQSNARRIDAELGGDSLRFSCRLQYFFKHEVIREDAAALPSMEALQRRLRQDGTVSLRMRTQPDACGRRHFELSLVRVPSAEGLHAVLGFRYVDALLQAEEEGRRQLEQALAQARASSELISAISRTYWLLYRLDLPADTFEQVVPEGRRPSPLGGGKTSERFPVACGKTTAAEYIPTMLAFLDTSTLPERLRSREVISQEYRTTTGNWHEGSFIVQRRNDTGAAEKVLYAIRIINDQKQQEMEYERRLSQSAAEARRANLAKTDFLRRMSHDVRTPINAIRGMVEIANHFPRDYEKLQACRDKVWQASGYLLALVDSVLDMSKLESGGIELDSAPFDLSRLLGEVNAMAETQATEHGLRYVVEDGPGAVAHPGLLGDPLRLKQVLLNLTGNAIKYNRLGGEVRVSCRETAFDGRTATFCFVCADNGIGMSPAFQKHVFEPFTQEQKNDARTSYSGSGLGLSIVHSLVEKMGGSITFDSREGEGTRFCVTLPFAVCDTLALPEAAGQETAAAQVAGAHVLLVEDNDLNLEIARFFLEQAGVIVAVARNGQQAVETFAACPSGTFDAVFMDVMMPVMDGLTAAQTIRRLPRPDAAAVPIFAMTANAFPEDIQKCRAAGMNEHLGKPLDQAAMLRVLGRWLGGRPE